MSATASPPGSQGGQGAKEGIHLLSGSPGPGHFRSLMGPVQFPTVGLSLRKSFTSLRLAIILCLVHTGLVPTKLPLMEKLERKLNMRRLHNFRFFKIFYLDEIICLMNIDNYTYLLYTVRTCPIFLKTTIIIIIL